MQQIISTKNSKILRKDEPITKQCSCPKNKECPLNSKCLTKNLVYQATVELENHEPKTYIGQASTDFKSRLATHKHSFKNPEVNQTSLSKHVQDLKSKGHDPKVTWKIDSGPKFSPAGGVCLLCIKEAYFITFHPEMAALNSRSEIFSSCRHKKSALLIKATNLGRKKKPPGT